MSSIDLEALRKKLDGQSGKHYWRSLDELAETDEFRTFVQNEFGVEGISDNLGRRKFMHLMGASFALAGVGACTRQPDEKLIPFVRSPENTIPGKPKHFATAMQVDGGAIGVLAESHMGRPTKLDGNPDHPYSLGASDSSIQAAVLDLYDPDRSKTTNFRGRNSTFAKFAVKLREVLAAQAGNGGSAVRILLPTVYSPTAHRLLGQVLEKYPNLKVHSYDPAFLTSAKRGSQLALGRVVEVHADLSKAKTIVSLDADFMSRGTDKLRNVRAYSAGRAVDETKGEMSRFYMVEATTSLTGANADHRLRVKTSEVQDIAWAIANELGLSGRVPKLSSAKQQWVKELAKELKSNAGKSLILVGDEQPAEVHALAHHMNAILDNVGASVWYTESTEQAMSVGGDLKSLVDAMHSGEVSALFLLGVNPIYDAPHDLRFAEGLAKVLHRFHLGTHQDETSRLCDWHIPQTHFLEEWGDLRAKSGVASIVQPLIAPLYKGKSIVELLAMIAGIGAAKSVDLVRETWATHFETSGAGGWRAALHSGLIAGTENPHLKLSVNEQWFSALEPMDRMAQSSADSIELNFRPDPLIGTGQSANNGWLQEQPKPLTKLTWDNALFVSPLLSQELGLKNEDLVAVKAGDVSLEVPVWIVPGHADKSCTLHLGGGRTYGGNVSKDVGVNPNLLRSLANVHLINDIQITKTGRTYALACVQMHHSMEGRDLVREGTREEYLGNSKLFVRGHDKLNKLSIYPDHKYEGYAWGMNIDLNACIGCNACSISCQAENNIAIVGKEEVRKGREMSWLRVDHYYSGSIDNPKTSHQPVACVHCENAPCEVVCPATATVHSSEGLNDMVYNRCIGTRYCANNCPYKVRRFNFFLYSDFETESLKLMRNPDVTVRSRGVMEKCTYCVQSINQARITAKKENRSIRDGDIVTACQSACAANAITFGDINDKKSVVSKAKESPRRYELLGELGLRPRTTYTGKIRNPNPSLTEEV